MPNAKCQMPKASLLCASALKRCDGYCSRAVVRSAMGCWTQLTFVYARAPCATLAPRKSDTHVGTWQRTTYSLFSRYTHIANDKTTNRERHHNIPHTRNKRSTHDVDIMLDAYSKCKYRCRCRCRCKCTRMGHRCIGHSEIGLRKRNAVETTTTTKTKERKGNKIRKGKLHIHAQMQRSCNPQS